MAPWTDTARRHWRELRRRRVVRTLAAYLVFAWLLLQVADVTFEPLGLPAWSQRALIFAVAAGIVPVAVLAWIFDIRGRRVVRTAPLADAATAAPPARPGPAAAAPAAFSPIAALAILPFADLSQARDQGWFCDGLAEEIIDALCCVRGLRVASRSASFRFRDADVDPREIGRQLAVDAILEGSVRKAGDLLKVSAQLVDAGTGFHLWTERFEMRVEDVFAIQAEIARQVAAALRLSVGPALDGRERHAPRNMAAYEYYLRGRQLTGGLLMTRAGWDQAPVLFRRAIELDPDYAQAHAGLADALAQKLMWRWAKPEDVLPEATAAASRALDLAPDLAEAHVAQGHLRSLAGDAAGALRSFERALELNPGLHEAYYYYARHLYVQGDYLHAARMYEQAFRTRSDNYVMLASASSSLDAGGDAAGAEAMARRALPGLLRQIELDPDNPRPRYMAAGLLLRVGDAEAGRAQVEAALRMHPDDYATIYNAACYFSLAGDSERAFELLERCVADAGYKAWIANDPDFANIRDDPRFAQLMAQLA